MTAPTLDLFASSGATFSPCRTWRYRLWRPCADGNRVLAICGLNPSVADETRDDNTVRRCIDFGKQWGFARLVMLNAFALRSTDPLGLLDVADPIGPENDRHIAEVVAGAARVVLAWGRHQAIREILRPRAERVRALVREHARCEIGTFGANEDGSPKHPLYLAKTTRFQVMWGAR